MNAQIAPYSIYEKLLELPLFQGHSREDLTSMLTKIKVDFRHFKAGHEIVAQHDPCREIFFLMDGEVVASRCSFLKELLSVSPLPIRLVWKRFLVCSKTTPTAFVP